MRYLLLSVLVVYVIGVMVPNAFAEDQTKDTSTKEIFEMKKTDILFLLKTDQGFPYHFGSQYASTSLPERDFTKEQGITEANYQLYKLIDVDDKRVGDLRFYLGSSEWWDENADLQEDDTSGFENIFKVKIFLMHNLEPHTQQYIFKHLTTALHILVPGGPGADIDNKLDIWFHDSVNFSERNPQGKRANYMTENGYEIKVFHEDLDYGSVTIIVTEDADTISLERLEGCGEGTILVNGVCQLAEPVDTSRPDTFTNGLIFVLILAAFSPIIIIPLIRYRKNKATYDKLYGYEKPSQKPAKKKKTSAFCENCGNSLKKTAKFCGGCGTPRS